MLFQICKTFVDLQNTNEGILYALRVLSECIKSILICVSNMNEGLAGLERHEGE